MSAMSGDEAFMAEAIALSLTHLGQTSTNPSVGCVIVRDGIVVGRGVTAVGGRPHAETEALAEAGEQARGATVYVTLEPCSHHGRTPPCANALIAAGVSRVVVSVIDPDERVSGRGLQILRDAGVTVETGLLETEGRRALAGYLTRKLKHRAHVTLKLAVSADGMIGRKGEGQVAITGPAARQQVHRMRAETDAILIGIGTALADDPELTVRLAGLEERSPVRIVLDRRLELPLTSKLVRTAREVPVVVVTDASDTVSGGTAAGLPPSVLPDISPTWGEIDSRRPPASIKSVEVVEASGIASPISPHVGEMSGRTEGGKHPTILDNLSRRRAVLQSAGVDVLEAQSLGEVLAMLAEGGMSTLIVEGGASVAKAFLAAGLVDRIILFTGPGEIGGQGIASPVTGSNIPAGFTHYRSETYGPDRCDYFERDH